MVDVTYVCYMLLLLFFDCSDKWCAIQIKYICGKIRVSPNGPYFNILVLWNKLATSKIIHLKKLAANMNETTLRINQKVQLWDMRFCVSLQVFTYLYIAVDIGESCAKQYSPPTAASGSPGTTSPGLPSLNPLSPPWGLLASPMVSSMASAGIPPLPSPWHAFIAQHPLETSWRAFLLTFCLFLNVIVCSLTLSGILIHWLLAKMLIIHNCFRKLYYLFVIVLLTNNKLLGQYWVLRWVLNCVTALCKYSS